MDNRTQLMKEAKGLRIKGLNKFWGTKKLVIEIGNIKARRLAGRSDVVRRSWITRKALFINGLRANGPVAVAA